MSSDPVGSDALSAIGLSGSPLSPSDNASADFVSPLRENQVQRASHLCRYGDQMLVIAGGPGSGKTFFLTKLAIDLADLPNLVILDAGQYDESADAFWSDLLRQLEPMADDNLFSVGAQLAKLRSLLAQYEEPPVLLIDNGHKFSDSVLAMLLSLMSSVGGSVALKTVLAGDQQLVQRLDALNSVEVTVYDLELAAVSTEQWQNFCDIQLRLFGLAGESPIDAESLQVIVAVADGNVREIFERLDDKLREVSVAPTPKTGNLGLPPLHLAMLVGLVVCLVLVVLAGGRLWGDGDEDPEESAYDKNADVKLYDQRPEPATKVVTIDDSIGRSSADQTLGPPLGASDEPAPMTSADDSYAAGKDLPKAENPGEDEVNLPVATSEPKPAVKVPVSQPQSTTVKPAPAPEPSPSASVPQVADTTTATTAPKGTSIASQKQSSDKPKTASTASSWKGSRFDLPDNRYVLQIMAATNAEALEDFVATQSNRNTLYVVNIKRSGGDWFVLLQGDYASPEAARAAIKTLPKAQQKDGVWPRSALEIKAYLSGDG